MLQLAVQKNPNRAYAHYYLGVLHADDGDVDLAKVAFRRALELEPTFSEAAYNLGTLYLETRELEAAVELLDPDRPEQIGVEHDLAAWPADT